MHTSCIHKCISIYKNAWQQINVKPKTKVLTTQQPELPYGIIMKG